MNAVITPSLPRGVVQAPPSKSYAHRHLICAMLADGGKVCGISLSDDIRATLRCMSALGVRYEYDNGVLAVISGIDKNIDRASVNVGESGSTLRFFIPICLALGGDFTFTGSERLFERPLSVYADICAKSGIKFDPSKGSLHISGRLEGGNVAVPGNISSQFISGLLFAGALTVRPLHIAVTGETESAPYIDMTCNALAEHGIYVQKRGNVYSVRPGSLRKTAVEVERDWSNAAYLLAFNYIGGAVRVTGLDENSLQGDKVCLKLFEKLVGGTPVISVADCPDLFPALCVVAALNNGAEFTHISRLRLKESDRAGVMERILAKFGAETELYPDNIVINPCDISMREQEVFDCSNDHRIVMALALLMSVYGGTILNAGAVKKSFPEYFTVFRSIGGEVRLYEDK